MSIEMNKAKFAHAEYQKILQEEKKVQDAKAQVEWDQKQATKTKEK